MSYYVIIRGPLGCGKSTVAEGLANRLGAKHYSVDKVLDEHGLTVDKEEGYISQESFRKANGIIAPGVIDMLNRGALVIFDGNFYWKSQIEDLIARLHHPHYAFTLKASLEACVKRDGGREKVYGADAVRAVYKKSTEFDYGAVIDTENKSAEATIEEILSYLPGRGKVREVIREFD